MVIIAGKERAWVSLGFGGSETGTSYLTLASNACVAVRQYAHLGELKNRCGGKEAALAESGWNLVSTCCLFKNTDYEFSTVLTFRACIG